MKKLIFLILLILISYSIYFDITTGTLPSNSNPASKPSTSQENETTIPFIELRVEAGDTLISIMESEEGTISQPIQTIIDDFQKLNNGTSPHELQIGKTYKFPSY